METKEYLYKLRIADTKINNKLEELSSLENIVYKLGGAGFGERVQSSKSSDLSDRIVKVADFKIELNKDIDEYVDLKAKITKEIDLLKDSELINLLYKRYVHNKSWRDISLEMKYSEKHIFKLHGKALKEFEKVKSGY